MNNTSRAEARWWTCTGFLLGVGLLFAPPVTAGTQLADTAAAMAPGTWVELNTIGLTGSFLADPANNGHHILQYSDKAVWDSVNKTFVYAGSGHLGLGKTIIYTPATNTWSQAAVTSCDDFPHNYQRITFNAGTGLVYKNDGSVNCTYSSATDTWGSIAGIPFGNQSFSAGLEYFPERNRLYWTDAEYSSTNFQRIAEFQFPNGPWNLLWSGLNGGSNHMVAMYSPVYKVLMMGGGEGSTALHRINQDGTKTEMTAPFSIGVIDTVFTLDPMSGNYLVLRSNHTFYEFNPTGSGTWTQLTGAKTPPNFWDTPTTADNIIAAPITTYGVTMFVAYHSGSPVAWLYKNSSSTPDTTPPSIPTNLTATAISSSQINLAWTASTDTVGVSGYRIYRGGTQVATSPANSYSNTGLAPSTTYSYAVAAYDAAGNVSPQSGSASATTQAAAAFNFSLTPAQASVSVSQGQSVSSTITATLSSGTSQAVSLSAAALPALTGGTMGFSPTTCTPTCTLPLTVTTLAATPIGSYTITVTGTGGGLTRTTTFTVTVTAPPSGRTIHIYPGTDVFGSAAQGLQAGDTLIVHQGTYNETTRMSIQAQGTATQPILIQGADGEAKPIITRPGSASVQNTINIEGSARYVTIKGLDITGNGTDGVELNGALSYITLEDLVIHDIDVGIGIHTNVDHITIRTNHIYRTGIGGGTGEGMYIGCNYASCAVTDSLIEHNWIHDELAGITQGDGIEVKYGSIRNTIKDNVIYNKGNANGYPCIFVYGYPGNTDRNTVEGNVLWNCGGEGVYAVSDATVRNNLVFESGAGIGSYGHAQVPVFENTTVVNNTLFNNSEGLYLRWGGTNMVLANNAIYSPGQTAINSAFGISGTVRANYVEGAVDVPLDGVAFVGGGSASAALANPTAMDVWPKAGSPLLGTANASFAPSLDFNGTARTSPYDVGAYETNGQAANPGWTVQPGFKTTLSPGLRGDLDGNGTVDLDDLRRMIYMLVGQQPVDLSTADLDGDGQLLLVDLQALVRVLVGLP